jgi:hypothetical protein
MFSVAILLIASAHADPLRSIDDVRAFRGVPFGSPMAQLEGAEVVVENEYLTKLRRPADALQLGDIPLNHIRYVYRDDQLATVEMEAPLEHGSALLFALRQVFGHCHERPDNPPLWSDLDGYWNCTWYGERTLAIFLAIDGDAVFFITDAQVESSSMESETRAAMDKASRGRAEEVEAAAGRAREVLKDF